MSEKIDERDRLTFWRNWYTAARQLPDDLRLAWLDAVLDFAFTGKEPKPAAEGASVEDGILTAIGYQAVQMVRATIEISRKRKQSGSKGGASRKQSGSKHKANAKQTRSKTKADPKQVQEQVQEQEQEQYANSISATTAQTRGKLPPTIEQFQAMAVKAGVPPDFAEYLHGELTRCDWTAADGSRVANPIRYLKSAWNAEQKKIRGARASGESAGELGLGGGIRIAR